MELTQMELEKHYVNRSGWIRAAVLGANDGILSTTSIAIGVAAASQERAGIVLAALAGLVAGAMSMAAGEYVSVSSQSDIETADLIREKLELETIPEVELQELAKIYETRGLSAELSMEVATALTKHDALGAHAKDELGIHEISKARPLQAAMASFGSFVAGAALPRVTFSSTERRAAGPRPRRRAGARRAGVVQILGRVLVDVGERALDRPDHVGDGDLVGLAGEPVAAAGAATAFTRPRVLQVEQDVLEELERDLLRLGQPLALDGLAVGRARRARALLGRRNRLSLRSSRHSIVASRVTKWLRPSSRHVDLRDRATIYHAAPR